MNYLKSSIIPMAILFVCVLTVQTASADTVKWYSYDEGMALAKQEGKHVYINFHADWCGYCHKMVKNTFKDKSVVAFLNENYISIRLNSDKERKLARQYGVRGLPENWFLTSTGARVGNKPGYMGPKDFLKVLTFVHEKKYASGKQ